VYKRPFCEIIESNRIEKSIRQRESNRIEFSPNRNALYSGLVSIYSVTAQLTASVIQE